MMDSVDAIFSTIMRNDGDAHWKFTWPSAIQLAQFVVEREGLFRESTIVELGAGATGVVGLAAARIGARSVYLTELHTNLKALELLEQNAEETRNCISDGQRIIVEGLDWCTSLLPSTSCGTYEGNVRSFVNRLEVCDFILASDVFYDEALFEPLVHTIALFLEKFPRARVYFSYHLRDTSYSIAHLLEADILIGNHLKTLHIEGATIQIGLIYKSGFESTMYAGIEGGGTKSKLVFVDSDGKRCGEADGEGTNMYLNGLQKTADSIALWVRKQAEHFGISLPLKSLGMGLSGAEDDSMIKEFVDYMYQFHQDVAQHFSLCSDSISTIQAAFEKEGVVFIAGTGSACRLLLSDGSKYGAGGWGHMVGEGGSGFSIARRAIRVLFDHDDNLQLACGDVEVLRSVLLKHFNIKDKVGILRFLYAEFNKSVVAAFTTTLSQHATDPVIANVFFEAGENIGKQLVALSRHMPENMLRRCDVVAVGSVFKSWNLLRGGFVQSLRGKSITGVRMCRLMEEPSFGAAVLAARETGHTIPLLRQSEVFDDILV